MKRITVPIGVGLIHLYRIVFFWLPSSCRFEPSCSRYTEQAIVKYGLFKGSWMGAKRDRALPSVESGGLRPCPLTLAGAGV